MAEVFCKLLILLGRNRPFSPVTGVRIPLGAQTEIALQHVDILCMLATFRLRGISSVWESA